MVYYNYTTSAYRRILASQVIQVRDICHNKKYLNKHTTHKLAQSLLEANMALTLKYGFSWSVSSSNPLL